MSGFHAILRSVFWQDDRPTTPKMLLQSSPSSLPSDPFLTADPSSPPLSPPQADLFTDIFSSSPSPPLDNPRNANADSPSTSVGPSDIPRLRATHVTAGYREGIAAAKASALQGGFDEGYPLGAVMGLRTGEILGILEGLSKALESALTRAKNARSEENTEITNGPILEREVSECLALSAKANEELDVGKMFGREFWSEDGTWTYEVEVKTEGEEPSYADVVSSHPLIRKWESKINVLMDKYRLREARWVGEDWEKGRVKDEDVVNPRPGPNYG